MPINNDDFKSTINSLRNVDFENPEARFRALELSLIQTANCAQDSHMQAKATSEKVSNLIDVIAKNSENIAANASTIKGINKIIYPTFGAVILTMISFILDKVFGIFQVMP